MSYDTLSLPTQQRPRSVPLHPKNWTFGDEVQFRQWYGFWSSRAGINPNPDDPRHRYDYRRAFAHGATPSLNPDDGRLHWPSEFKRAKHPNRYVEGKDTRGPRPPAGSGHLRYSQRRKQAKP